jgi:hypothetical protein
MPHYQIQIAVAITVFLLLACVCLVGMLAFTRSYVRYLAEEVNKKNAALLQALDKIKELRGQLQEQKDDADWWKTSQRSRCRRNN